MRHSLLAVGPLLLAAAALAQSQPRQPTANRQDDVLLRAMKDEIKRVSALVRLGLDPPYYTEYRVEDTVSHSITASLGALVEESDSDFRVPSVQMRVGAANFDNTDHVFSEAYVGNRYDPGRLPLDNDYLAFRQIFWLATDRAYKTAEDAIARKRSSLKNMTQPECLPDFSTAPPAHLISAHRTKTVCLRCLEKRSNPAVGGFGCISESVQLRRRNALLAIHQLHCQFGRHGTAHSRRSRLSFACRRMAWRPMDRAVRDALVFQAFNADGLPSEDVLTREVKALGEHVTALSQAPAGEAYDGPVLFEAPAAAQLFGQLLGDNLKVHAQTGERSWTRISLFAERIGEQDRLAHSAGLDGRGGRSRANAISGPHAAGTLPVRHGRRCRRSPSRWWRKAY